MRPCVASLLAVLFLAACSLQTGDAKMARRGREAWVAEGRTYELTETYYKRAGNSVRFVMVTKVAATMLSPDEAKALALPLIRYARDHGLHERITIPPLKGNVPTMMGFAVEFVANESGKVLGDYDVPGGEVTWRLAHPHDP